MNPAQRGWRARGALWWSTLVALLGVWTALCWSASSASARDAYRVVVVEGSSLAPLARELEVRLKGELAAAGFEVVSLAAASEDVPARAAATLGSEYQPVAVFAAAHEVGSEETGDASSTLRLWLSDRRTAELELFEREHAFAGSRAASSLAVQGTESLQARLADWRWPAPPQPVEPAPRLPVPAAGPAPQFIPTLDLGMLLDSATGGAALTPLLRLCYLGGTGSRQGVSFGGRVSLAGLGTPTVLETAQRQVEVRQSFALLEGVLALDTGSWLRPFAASGLGAYRVDVRGVAATPVVGRSEATLSALGSLGLGLWLHPGGDWVGRLEAQSLLALQPTAVEIEATRVATFGRPLFVFSAGIGIAF